MPDNTNPTINQDLTQIRTAVYGRDVREAIADGIEHCYNDNTSAIAQAVSAASEAQTAIQNVNTVLGQAQTALQQANTAAATATTAANNINATAAKETDGPYTISVTNSAGNTTTIEIPDPAAEVKKKANLEAVTVKKTVGPGDFLTFQDGVDAPAVKTTIRLEPKQDLHGYDHAWVGGAGKNLFNPEWFIDRTANGVTSEWTDDGKLWLHGTPSNGTRYSDSAPHVLLPAGTYKLTSYPKPLRAYTASGLTNRISNVENDTFTVDGETPIFFAFSSITINEAYDEIEEIMLEPYVEGEAASPWEPYENICPIEGYEGVTVTRTGKNLLGNWSVAGVANQVLSNLFPIELLNNWWFKVSKTQFPDVAVQSMIRFFSDENAQNMVARTSGTSVYPRILSPNTSCSDGTKVTDHPEIKYFAILVYNLSNALDEISKYGIQLSAHDYNDTDTANDTISYPMNFGEVSISFASVNNGTVYGGTVELNEDGSGTVTIDRYCHEFDGTEYHSYVGNPKFIRWSGSQYPAPITGSVAEYTANTWCSHAECKQITTSNSAIAGYVYPSASNGGAYIQLRLPMFGEWTEEEAFQYVVDQYNAGTPITMGYTMGEPITYQLTATQVQTLVGTNHVWTDAGEITLQYRSDKYAELERRINALEAMLLEQPFDGSVEG